jgi:hypothetical protein
MLYAVTIEPLKAIFFLSEPPQGNDWQVQEGVWLDVPSNYHVWPEGDKCPEQVLCTSISNPLHYKLFKYSKDIDPTEFRPTTKHFGGVYSRSSWGRFVKNLPAALAVAAVPDRERPGATDEAVAAIKARD